jgi:hypothetical protein
MPSQAMAWWTPVKVRTCSLKIYPLHGDASAQVAAVLIAGLLTSLFVSSRLIIGPNTGLALFPFHPNHFW